MRRGWLGGAGADKAAKRLADAASRERVEWVLDWNFARSKGLPWTERASRLSRMGGWALRGLLSQERVDELAAVSAYAGDWEALGRWVERHGAGWGATGRFKMGNCPEAKGAPHMEATALRLAVLGHGAVGAAACLALGADGRDVGALALATVREAAGEGEGAMEALAAAGADPNAIGEAGWEWPGEGRPSAMCLAAASEGATRKLLAAGGSAAARDSKGRGALMWAMQLGCAGAGRALLEAGAPALKAAPKARRSIL